MILIVVTKLFLFAFFKWTIFRDLQLSVVACYTYMFVLAKYFHLEEQLGEPAGKCVLSCFPAHNNA